jgi:transposase InsO family protein
MGLYHYKDRIYVPGDGAAREQILRTHHDDPLAGHFGFRRTMELIQRKYYWPRLAEDVKDYVRTCSICPRVKSARHKPYGALQPLPVPKGPWTDLTMDFITGLPPSGRKGQAYDAILVVVDRFTKMAIYVAVRKTIDSVELASALMAHVISKHGVPESIVSDRGTVFTSGFWRAYCDHAQIKRRLSTSFHP